MLKKMVMRWRRYLAIVAAFSAVLGLAGMPALTVKAQSPVKIALYSQSTPPGADWRCVVAERAMFESMGAIVTEVYAADIIGGALANYDILVMPGGYALYYKLALGTEGVQKIKDFVSSGGGYIGICAGAWFAVDYDLWYGIVYEYPLDLFPGYGEGPIPELTPGYPEPPRPVDAGLYCRDYIPIMTEIDLAKGDGITDGLSTDSLMVMYWGGPTFKVYEGQAVTVIGTYAVHNNEPAMVAFEYGSGKVFLTGVHPEFEEESMLDGLTFDNHLYDSESEWPLMQNVLTWLTS